MKEIEKYLLEKLPHWETIVFITFLSFFFLKLCFLATSILPGISPDEIEHTQRCLLHKTHWGLTLPDSPKTYPYGAVSRAPYLFSLLLGKLLYLNFLHIAPLIFLRFLNIAIGLISVMVAFQFFRLLCADKLVNLLGIIVLTNIPMYSFLSAFVSYDNLTNFLSTLSFFYLFSFLKTRKAYQLVFLSITLLAGCLTKFSFLPIPLIFGIILLTDYFFQRKKKIPFITFSDKKRRLMKIISFAVIGLLVFLNAQLYLVNLFKYKKVLPSCVQILSMEQCGKSDNAHVYWALRENAKRIPREYFLKPHEYFFHWKLIMGRTIFGIMGHRVLYRTSNELLPYYILLFLSLIFLIRNLNFNDREKCYSLMCVLMYTGVVFFVVNYPRYLHTAYPEAGLQGRYIFPVLTPTVFLFSYFLLNHKQKILKGLLFVLAVVIFIEGDIPYFLRNVPIGWFFP